MTTQLYRTGQAAVTVADPVMVPQYDRGFKRIGAEREALDGTLWQHLAHVGKRTWSPAWRLLTSDEKDALWAELTRGVPMTWKPPETATTFNVAVLCGDVSVAWDGFGWNIDGVVIREV